MGKNVAVKKKGATRRSTNGASKESSARGNDKRFGAFEVKLQEQRQEILDLLRQDLIVGQNLGQDGDDEVDRANIDFNRELALALSTGEREVLQQIGEALERLSEGSYGNCSNCERTIAEERLEAIPWARHCVECQELEEKGLLSE